MLLRNKLDKFREISRSNFGAAITFSRQSTASILLAIFSKLEAWVTLALIAFMYSAFPSSVGYSLLGIGYSFFTRKFQEYPISSSHYPSIPMKNNCFLQKRFIYIAFFAFYVYNININGDIAKAGED